LWDLAGQRQGIPVHEALGGAVASRSAPTTPAPATPTTPRAAAANIGGGDEAAGPYDDQVAFMRDAGKLAESLLSEGYKPP
jgi:galactonate dehydratase